MKKLFKISRAALLLMITVGLSPHTNAQGLEAKVDSMIKTVFKDPAGPGGVFMIAKNGKPVYLKGFGMANLETESEMHTGNVFQLGSMTKQFTAVAIMMLQEQGKLSTEDTISKYIPDFPNGSAISIHHLLTHTSGIKDFTKMKTIKDIAQKEMSPAMLLDFFKNEPVEFSPGEKFEYNNSGYVILGHIIEVVSGQTYEDFVTEHLFRKIGMEQSGYASDRKIIKNRAYGYHKKETGYVNKTAIHFSVPYASGALMATAEDMLKWQNTLKQYKVLSESTMKKVFSRNRLNNGEEFTYGYGWHIRELAGFTSYEHGGSVFGFKTMGVYIPEKDLYVLGLSNCDCNSPTQLTLDIAKEALAPFKLDK